MSILRSCGDGDIAIAVDDLVISIDPKQGQKGAENYHFLIETVIRVLKI